MSLNRLPTTTELEEAEQLDAILSRLMPGKCFSLFQESNDKCSASITKNMLTPQGMMNSIHYESKQSYSSIVENHLLKGLRLQITNTSTATTEDTISKASLQPFGCSGSLPG